MSQEKASLEESIENLTKEKIELNEKISSLESELKTNQENLNSNAEKNLVSGIVNYVQMYFDG